MMTKHKEINDNITFKIYTAEGKDFIGPFTLDKAREVKDDLISKGVNFEAGWTDEDNTVHEVDLTWGWTK